MELLDFYLVKWQEEMLSSLMEYVQLPSFVEIQLVGFDCDCVLRQGRCQINDL